MGRQFEHFRTMDPQVSFWEGLREGDILRLRDDAFHHVRVREWKFREMINGQIILLAQKKKRHFLEVKKDDIDWQAYRRRKKLRAQLIRLIPPAPQFSHKFDAAFEEKVSQLTRKYEPGTIMDIWAGGFKIYLGNCGWKLNKNSTKGKACQYLADYFFWIESLLKTWREEVGPTKTI